MSSWKDFLNTNDEQENTSVKSSSGKLSYKDFLNETSNFKSYMDQRSIEREANFKKNLYSAIPTPIIEPSIDTSIYRNGSYMEKPVTIPKIQGSGLNTAPILPNANNYTGDNLKPSADNMPDAKSMLQDTAANMVRGVNIKDKKVVTGTDYGWTKDTLMSGIAQTDSNIMNVLRMAHTGLSKLTDAITPDSIYDPKKDLVNKALDKSVDYYDKTSEDYREGHDYTGIRKYLGGALEALPATTTAFMGLPAFGTIAGGGYARESEKEGANYFQQLAMGAIGGMAEGLTEKIPFEKMQEVISGKLINQGAETLIKKYGKQVLSVLGSMATEFAQEAMVDPITDFAKKGIYKPDMPMVGEGGVIDKNKMFQDGLGGVALSVLMMGIGLPVNTISHKIAAKSIENKTKLDDEGLKELTNHVMQDISNLTPEETKSYVEDIPKVDINALPKFVKDKINPIPTANDLNAVAPLQNEGNVFIPKTPQSSLEQAQNFNKTVNIDAKGDNLLKLPKHLQNTDEYSNINKLPKAESQDLLPLPNFLKNKDSYSAINKLPKLDIKTNTAAETETIKENITSIKSKFNVSKTKDTRDNSDLWVIKINDKVTPEEYKKIADDLKKLGGSRYSRFTKGFNFKFDPTEKLSDYEGIKNIAPVKTNKLNSVPENINAKEEIKTPEISKEQAELNAKTDDIKNKEFYKHRDSILNITKDEDLTDNIIYRISKSVQHGWRGDLFKERAVKKLIHEETKNAELTEKVFNIVVENNPTKPNKDTTYFGNPVKNKTPEVKNEVKEDTTAPMKNRLSKLDEMAEAAKKRLEARHKTGKTLYAGLPMDDLVDYSIIGAAKLAHTAMDITQFTKELIAEHGENIRLFAAAIYGQSKAMLEMSEEDINKMIELASKEETKDNTDNKIDNKEGEKNVTNAANTSTRGNSGNAKDNNGEDKSKDVPQTEKSGKTGKLPSEDGRSSGRKDGEDRGKLTEKQPTSGNSDISGNTKPQLNDTKDGLGTDKRGTISGDSTASLGNHRIKEGDLEYEGGIKTRYKQNVDAINLLKKLEAEDRLATSEEQKILGKFVGFGGMKGLFNTYEADSKQWSNEREEFKKLLTTEEYEAARKSTMSAFYTSPKIIKSMYKALEKMGFKKGTILEPSMGVGNFFGMLPSGMSKSKLIGVELDSLTGRLAQKLYPKADIRITGFQNAVLPNDYMDIVVGNVPFADITMLEDKDFKKYKFNLHDYFIAKSLQKVRAGGIIAVITTKGTMDKKSSTLRRYLSDKAELIGAIRLPDTAFQKNANTQVTTDILFLRKLEVNETPKGEAWEHLGEIPLPEDKHFYDYRNQRNITGIPVNEYFINHPEMMLGEMVFDKGQYGGLTDTSLVAKENADLEKLFEKAINTLPENIYKDREVTKKPIVKPTFLTEADNKIKDNSYVIKDGKLVQRRGIEFVEVKAGKNIKPEKIKGLIKIREAAKAILEAQNQNVDDKTLSKLQKELNKAYDEYVKKHGLLSEKSNKVTFNTDPDYYLLQSLEKVNKKTGKVEKSDIFFKRTARLDNKTNSVDNAKDALPLVLNEKGYLDLDRITELSSKSKEEAIKELKGLIYLNPNNGTYETSDEYLSGNVREKLREAEAAAKLDPKYNENVEALKDVQPIELSPYDIKPVLGAAWIPKDVILDFAAHLFKVDSYYKDGIKVNYTAQSSKWEINTKGLNFNHVNRNSLINTWGTDSINGIDLLEKTLNMQSPVIYYPKNRDGSGGGKNVTATQLAMVKQEAIKDEFKKWVYDETNRRDRLAQIYNEVFNSNRNRAFDGSYQTFPRMNEAYTLMKHQKDSIARIVQGGNTLLAKCVGAGKTFIMQGASMELKRLGLSHKPLHVVKNAMVESGQYAKEFLELYPDANLLIATSEDFKKANRKALFARIATGNYDAVIIGHSSFKLIGLSVDTQAEFIKEQMKELEEAILSAREDDGDSSGKKKSGSKIVTDLEKAKERLSQQLKDLMDIPKDDIVTFEQMGIDSLFVDEAHNFKKLPIYTKLSRVAGISTGKSQMATDLYMKTRYINKLNGGERNVIFATGTPISNSMTEMYVMQKYLQPEALKAAGLQSFDAWASSFGEIVNGVEVTPTGRGFRIKQRFSKFVNAPEIISMFQNVADVFTLDMLRKQVKMDIPTLTGGEKEGQPIRVISETTKEQDDYIQSLIDRMEAIQKGDVEPEEDNALKVTTEGRKIALDQRLLIPNAEDVPDSKINQAVGNIYNEWKAGKKEGTTQIVFCDLGTPKKGVKEEIKPTTNEDGEEEEIDQSDLLDSVTGTNFDVYADIKKKLVQLGIPEKEIAFIHDAGKDKDKKSEMLADFRSGKIRIIIGSTSKMGEGTNMQDRVIAMHEIDCPYRPSDVEQREGRMIRQGNVNSKVKLYRYATKGTFDSYMWQMIERKANFIGQVMKGEVSARDIEDVDEVAMNAAVMKASASDNPLIMEKVQVDSDVQRLQALEVAHNKGKYRKESDLRHYKNNITILEKNINTLEKDIEARNKNLDKDNFSIKVNDKVITDKKVAGEAILEALKTLDKVDSKVIGEYSGFYLEGTSKVKSAVMTKDENDNAKLQSLIGYNLALYKNGEKYTSFDVENSEGVITRLNNLLEKLDVHLKIANEKLEAAKQNVKDLEVEIKKPFDKADELSTLTKRKAEIDIKLKETDKEADKKTPENAEEIKPKGLSMNLQTFTQDESYMEAKRYLEREGKLPSASELQEQYIKEQMKAIPKKQRQFIENSVLNSLPIPEEMKQEFLEHPEWYEYIERNNVQTKEWAEKEIANRFNEHFNRISRQTSLKSDSDTALAIEIARKFIEEGDYEGAKNWSLKIAKLGTHTGRAIQYFSVMKRLTPEWTLNYISKKIDKTRTDKQDETLNKTVNDLADKLNEENKKALDDVLKRILEGKSVDDLIEKAKERNKKRPRKETEKEKEETEELLPEDMLAAKVENHINSLDNESGKFDPIKAMVNTLYEVAKQTLPTKETIKISPMVFVNHAMENKEMYFDVWDKARVIVKEDFSGNEEALTLLDEYFKTFTEKPFSDKQLNKAVKEGIKKYNIDLNSLVKEHYSKVDKVGKTLASKLIDSGLSEENSILLEEYIMNEFDNIVSERKGKILDSMFKKRKIKNKELFYEKIIKLSNLGAFDGEKYKDLVAEKLGIPHLTTEMARKLVELSNEVQKYPDNSRERKEAYSHLIETMEDLLPKPMLRYVNAYQTMNMLLNTKTASRNFFSNILFGLQTHTKDYVKTGLDIGMSIGTKKRTTVLPSFKTKAEGFKEQGKEAILDFKHNVVTKDLDDKLELGNHSRKVFKHGVLGYAEKLTRLIMEDRPFNGAEFKDQMRRAREVAKLNNEEFNEAETIKRAMLEAERVTFNDKNVVSDAMLSVKKALNLGKEWGAGDIIMKFVRTPVNIFVREIEYTPLSFIRAIVRVASDKYKYDKSPLKNKETLVEFNQEAFVEDLSKAITGTAVIGLGIFLYKIGALILDEPDRDKRELEDTIGKGSFRINISAFTRLLRKSAASGMLEKETLQENDNLIAYDWAVPFAANMTLGAAMTRAKRATDFNNMDMLMAYADSLNEGINNILEQPFTQGIQTLFKAASLTEGAKKLAINTPNTLIPLSSTLNQVRQMKDDKARETYSPTLKGALANQIANRLPMLSEKLETKVDVLGRDKEVYKDSALGKNNALNVMLNPAIASKYKPTTASKEALDITDNTEIVSHIPKVAPKKFDINIDDKGNDMSINLTTKEYVYYQRALGLTISKVLESASKKGYDKDEELSKALVSEYADIEAAIKEKIMEDRGYTKKKKGNTTYFIKK